MNGMARMDDEGDTESAFFYAKDRGGYERKSDMETSYLARGITMPSRTDR